MSTPIIEDFSAIAVELKRVEQEKAAERERQERSANYDMS